MSRKIKLTERVSRTEKEYVVFPATKLEKTLDFFRDAFNKPKSEYEMMLMLHDGCGVDDQGLDYTNLSQSEGENHWEVVFKPLKADDSESVFGAPVPKRRCEEGPSVDVRLLDALQLIVNSQEATRLSIINSQEATRQSIINSQEATRQSIINSQESQEAIEKCQQETLRLLKELHVDAMSVSFSKASATKVFDMFKYFNLVQDEALRSDFIPDEKFAALPQLNLQPMVWANGEVASTPAALQYINDALIAHGALLLDQIVDENPQLNKRSRHFKIANVCSQNNLHLITDSTKFCGGIDGVILPMGVSKSLYQMQMRVGIELKDPSQVMTPAQWQQAINQARVQIVVANICSYHPVMHLLTDLVSRFKLFKIANRCVYEYTCPDASTAFKCLTNWLSVSSSDSRFMYIENETEVDEELKPSILGLINLQKKSNSSDLRDELKLDILEDLEPTERASYLYQTLMSRFGNLEIDANNNI